MPNADIEIRNSIRREIFESFNLYLLMPHIGDYKVPILDINMDGLSFPEVPGYTFKKDEKINCYLFIKKNIRIPLSVKIIHITSVNNKIGCEISNKTTKPYQAYSYFVKLLYSLSNLPAV